MLPDGFRYLPDVLPVEAESELLDCMRELPFKEFDFHGYRGKRRVVSYGWRYDFDAEALHRVDDMPPFLRALRGTAAGFAGMEASELQQALVTEYSAGAGIGWHRDKGVFGQIVASRSSGRASSVCDGDQARRGSARPSSRSPAPLTC